ncbi:3D domain-containing protein [Heyndrickxia camelliae]|uniref:3D domain-containing protein n=1 Tax=Heyndrickxia camelliae TaxID=1707093 RepID=A0A2N3LFY2_9BACI|nr:3D domain-containing protein [Heyndrickxia camelliae]PKR83528.1 hypothetical protein CWO92_18355 [Heyndrickxia camelliae]
MKQNTARNLVIAGTVLFASTVSIIYSDINRERIKYKNELESQVKLNDALMRSYKKQSNLLKDKENDIKELNKQFQSKDKTIKLQSNEIHRLKKQLEKAKKRNELPTKKLKMEVTSYIAHCKEGCTGITRSGYNVSNTIYYKGYRVVAADLNVLPLYSIIQIKTKHETFKAVVIDSGGAIVGNKLDLLSKDTQTAINFGRQIAEVTILRMGKEGNK